MWQYSVTGGGPLCTADALVVFGIHMFDVWELLGLYKQCSFGKVVVSSSIAMPA